VRGMRLEWILIACAAAAIAALAIGRQTVLATRPPSISSSYDAGPNGYRALYEVARRAGLRVSRFERPAGLLDTTAIGTLVFSTPAGDPSPQIPTLADVDAVRRFVSAGGRLIALDDDFAGKQDVTPGVGTSHAIATQHEAIPLAHGAYTAGVAVVRAPIDAVFGFGAKNGLPLLANDAGIVAMRYRLGKGEVIAVTAPALFSNANLASAQNARFAYDLLAGHGAIAFDEYVHGFSDEASFWSVLPPPVRAAIWIVAAIVLLGLAGANVRFAPQVALEPPDERDTTAYIDSMAALMRRARAARSSIGMFLADARRRRRGGEGAARALAQLERLHAIATPSDAALLDAAVLDYRLRKDLV